MDRDGFSNKVYIYTFILSVLVVLVHSVNFADSNTILLTMIQSSDFNHIDIPGLTGWAAHIENFLSNALGQAAVPGFFMMSGYLYFRTMDSFKDIGRKWKSRFHTLVVPFFAWNFIYYILYVLCGKARFSAYMLYDAILNYTYNHVFWYVHQLIMLTILTPLLYWILKKKLLAALFMIVYVSLIVWGMDFPFVNEDAMMYYFAGAYMAVNCSTFFEKMQKNEKNKGGKHYKKFYTNYISSKICKGVLLLMLVWGTQVFTTVGMQMFLIAPVDFDAMGTWRYWYYGGAVSTILASALSALPTGILVGILSIGGQVMVNVIRRLLLCVALWLLLQDKTLIFKNFMKNGFFLYAVHYPIARAGIYVLEYMNIGYHSTAEQIIRLTIYLMTPVVCVALSYILKEVMENQTPLIWKVLSGGR